MSWSSRIPDLLAALEQAVDEGLVAAGAVVADAVREEHRGGYTSGNFVTGAVLNSIVALAPVTEGSMRVLRVTTTKTQPPYPFFWTTGHFNKFSGRFERVDHWTPASEKSADAAAEAFAHTASASFSHALGI